MEYQKKTTLILSGGSFKGFAYIGVIKALKEIGIMENLKVFVGTSIGAIFALFLSLNSYIEEIEELINRIDFNKLFNYNFKNLYFKYGLNDGDNILNLLSDFFVKKNYPLDLTFKDLYDKTGNTLIINASNITTKKREVFDYLATPNMNILNAVRMSISIPFIFTPVIYNDNYYVDGGIIDSFMYNYMVKERIPKTKENKIIGVLLNDKINNNCDSFINYLMNIYYSLYSDLYGNLDFKNIININVENCNISTFKIKDKDIINIIKLGYVETINFFKKK